MLSVQAVKDTLYDPPPPILLSRDEVCKQNCVTFGVTTNQKINMKVKHPDKLALTMRSTVNRSDGYKKSSKKTSQSRSVHGRWDARGLSSDVPEAGVQRPVRLLHNGC